MTFKFKNSKGEEVTLNQKEKALASALDEQYGKLMNAAGMVVDITTLTTALKSVSHQKFFEVAPGDYMPINVGEGAFAMELLKWVDFAPATDFEAGNIKLGMDGSKMATADASVSAVKSPIINWGKKISWDLFSVNVAATQGNFDVVLAKERSRKKNWDLGIQKVAFLGAKTVPGVYGLLNQPDVTKNTELITEPLSGMTAAELSTFASKVAGAYRKNCNYSAKPTHFVIPESDFLGLGTPSNAEYPLLTKLQVLENAFKAAFGANFKVLPIAYGDKTVSGLAKNVYALYNFDPDSLEMNIPVQYTSTIANTIDGFTWLNTAYGQYSGVKAYRPKEMLYFEF